MVADLHMLDWASESLDSQKFQEEVVQWLRTDLQIGDDELGQDLIEVARLFLVMGWLERRLFAQHLGEHGLTIPQFFSLVTIHHCKEGCTMGTLAERTHQCSATMTGIVDRLLKMALVERKRAENDRRLVLVRLTEKGERILIESVRGRLDGLKRFLAGFDTPSRRQFIQAIKKSIEVMEDQLRESEVEPAPEQAEVVSCCG